MDLYKIYNFSNHLYTLTKFRNKKAIREKSTKKKKNK